MATVPVSLNGIEIDMLSLGDADCIVVTLWNDSFPWRVLIDGGSGGNADVVKDFLRSWKQTSFWAVLCTHAHNDHARGLIKLIQDPSFSFSNGWMHDLRKHIDADALRRAAATSDGIKEIVETTKELASAFASRGIKPLEPFAGCCIAAWPNMHVLGPSIPCYKSVLEEFTKVAAPFPVPSSVSPFWTTLLSTPASPSAFGLLIPPSPRSPLADMLSGALENSSVKEVPTTQPFNNTSVILGVNFMGHRLLFTADAGAEALDLVPADWRGLKWMQVPHHGSDGNLSQQNIEKFCPEAAFISAKGDSSHPSRAIVNGLIKIGAKVYSTHTVDPGHLWFPEGNVPSREDYGPAAPLKATGGMDAVDLGAIWASVGRNA